ncbi:hypothetical protein Glove_184g149 [Diversispora epigaea]|uniref:Uncharacterized protein n=1 Tax=Diversispora epigaea TaxID=1348612 RepID=A0A397ITR4_9GLOM|nr:hypothetical protein Glove_184g149 [Diversispora epigaea]
MNSIESLNSLTSKFALEYSNRVKEIVQQTEINNPEHESFYTLKDLNRVKDCIDQIEHHKRRHCVYQQQQQQPPRPSLNTLLPPRSPPLPPHNQIRNTSPEGSNFSQTRPTSRSNTPDSTASESFSRSRSISPINNQQRDLLTEQGNTEIQYRPLIPRNRNAATEIDMDNQLLITFRTSTNNDREEELEPNEEELPEENIPIDTYNKLNLRQFLNYINLLNNNPVPEVNNHSGNNSENSDEEMAVYLVKPSKFSGTYGEDPLEWLQEFITVAKANVWNADRKIAVFGDYLRKRPREWHDEWTEANGGYD